MKALYDMFLKLPVWQRFVIGLPMTAVVLTCFAVGVDFIASIGRIHPGLYVSGVYVGGLKVDAAASRISKELNQQLSNPVTVVFDDIEIKVTADELAAKVDGSQAADMAYSVGRTGSLQDILRNRVDLWFGGIELMAPITVDESRTASVLERIAKMVDRPAQNASVVIEGTSARLERAKPGVVVRKEILRDDLLRALVSNERRVEISVDHIPASITDEDTLDALRDTRLMLAGDVAVIFEGRKWQFGKDRIAKWIAFRTVPLQESSGSVAASGAELGGPKSETTQTPFTRLTSLERRVCEAYIDPARLSPTIKPMIGDVGRPAKNATFKVQGKNVAIIPSQDGIAPDMDALAHEMTRVLTSGTQRLVKLRLRRVTPDLTTAEAQKMGIKTRISTYTTTYSSNNRPRVNNIHTLADALDNILVAPGATFSLNESVGPRTAAKGYQEAPAIIGGRLVPSLGGGVCQVGTTMFNAVFESGLPIIERRNHSFYISSYPKGRDATLSWGGQDFKFKNDTEHWILITTSYTSTSLTVSLYGTDPGYEVTSETGPWMNIKPFPVREVPDPELPIGVRQVKEPGVNGATIVVKRFVRKNGALVREDTFRSVYRPKEEVVHVGTKPLASREETLAVP